MTDAGLSGLHLAVHEAVASVDDPEYPGISIVDLGLLESISIAANGDVRIELIPTFSGCPALAVIAGDVRAAVDALPETATVEVAWLASPVWDISRVSHDARTALGRDFTVAVDLGVKPPRCPRCDAPTREQSLFGPSRCRSVHRCTGCGETVEVMRS